MEPEERSGKGAPLALEVLRQRLQDGEYAPRSRLPRETDLAAELGVSRGALREALRALELVGLVESRHGSGTYVTGLRARDLFPGLGDGLYIDATSALELVDFRRLVEPSTTVLAVRNATAKDRARIREILERSERTVDASTYLELDCELHRAIAAAAGNSILGGVLSSIAYGAAWKRMWGLILGSEVPERTRREHESLVVAIETGDEELAAATSHVHLANAQREVRAAVQRDDFDPRSQV